MSLKLARALKLERNGNVIVSPVLPNLMQCAYVFLVADFTSSLGLWFLCFVFEAHESCEVTAE